MKNSTKDVVEGQEGPQQDSGNQHRPQQRDRDRPGQLAVVAPSMSAAS